MTKLSQQAKDNILLKLNNDIEDCKFELRQNCRKINELSNRQKVLKKEIFELNKLIKYLK